MECDRVSDGVKRESLELLCNSADNNGSNFLWECTGYGRGWGVYIAKLQQKLYCTILSPASIFFPFLLPSPISHPLFA